MAELVFDDCYVEFNSTQLNGVKSVTLNTGMESVDNTVMGDNTRSSYPGLLTWSASVTFRNDFDASAIDDQLNGFMTGTSTQRIFSVEFRPTTAAVSTQNPSYTGFAFMQENVIFSGSAGDHAEKPVNLVAARSSTGGTSADLSRATS